MMPEIARARVLAARSAATRLQRRLALAVVIVPALGAAVALRQALREGVAPAQIAILVGMYAVTALGIEVGFHRLFSHHAFSAGPAVRALLAISGSMAAEGPVVFWAAIHRRHHAFTDVPGDPHSPNLHGDGLAGLLRGLWHAHVGWLFTAEATDWARYAPDLLRDRVVFGVNRLYPLWVLSGLAIPAALGALFTRSWEGAYQGVLWGGLVRLFLVHHFTWSVNSFGHRFGRRAFESGGQSRNTWVLALVSMGGSWHNNHHAFPSAARTGLAWWQLDPAGAFIDLLALLGLGRDVKRHSKIALAARHAPQVEGDGPSVARESGT